ncbi:MAG: hypothetical protein K6C97_10390 [Treponema sp.]|nr:hypothetical protein [Treponema sp.]
MAIEQLSPDTLTDKIKKRRDEMNHLLVNKLRNQKNTPKGHLRIAQAKGGRKIQYYHITKKGDTRGTYIPHSQISFARRLAQKQYDLKLMKELKKTITTLDKVLKVLSKNINAIYDRQCISRQKLITPVTLPDDAYLKEWQKIEWKGLPFSEDAQEFYTARNERVRSKSEVIIADTLNRHRIAYRYEYPLQLKDGLTFHPDFKCLNLRTRQEFYWEHFGMMDDIEYVRKTISKLRTYQENNIFPGKNLIMTWESSEQTINSKIIEGIIETYLV